MAIEYVKCIPEWIRYRSMYREILQGRGSVYASSDLFDRYLVAFQLPVLRTYSILVKPGTNSKLALFSIGSMDKKITKWQYLVVLLSNTIITVGRKTNYDASMER